MKLKVGTRELKAMNCSVGGFMAHGLESFARWDRFTGVMEPADGPFSEFTGQVTRVEDDGARAVRFVEVDLNSLLALQNSPTLKRRVSALDTLPRPDV